MTTSEASQYLYDANNNIQGVIIFRQLKSQYNL